MSLFRSRPGKIQNEKVLIEHSTLSSPQLFTCVLKELQTLKFEPRKFPTTITAYPIQFAPETAE